MPAGNTHEEQVDSYFIHSYVCLQRDTVECHPVLSVVSLCRVDVASRRTSAVSSLLSSSESVCQPLLVREQLQAVLGTCLVANNQLSVIS